MILDERVTCGPNVWSTRPVWEIRIGAASNLSAEARRSLREWLSRAAEAVGARDCACIETPAALRDCGDLAEWLGWLVLELQRIVQVRVEQTWRVPHADGSTTLAIEFEEEPLVRACWSLAVRWCEAARTERPVVTIETDVEALRRLALDVCVGATTRAMCDAAKARGIPVRRLDHESLIQLGYGARQRRLLTTMTDRASSLAEKISDDKWLTKQLLREAGFPVASGRVVTDADDAWRAARECGLPCVVKPRNDDYGHGVSLRLMSEAEVRTAFDLARTFKPEIIVEQHRPGVHHRLFVMNDRVVAAVRRDPAQVVGDGRHSIAELVEIANRDPRRDDHDPNAPLWTIELNDDERRVLADQQLTAESIPAAGRVVPLRYDSRTSYGGTNVDCTADVHHDFALLAIDAVRLIGLDIAGVDLLADDIGRSPAEQTVSILEINSAPSLLPHVAPLNETPQPMCDWILDALFPMPESWRFPIVAIAESDSSLPLARRLADALSSDASAIGLACADGVWLGDRRLTDAPSAHRDGTRVLLAHPRTEAAICELSSDSRRDDGLPFERCDVAVLLADEMLSCNQRLANVSPIELLARSATVAVVVNVDDPQLAVLAARWPQVIPISTDEVHPMILEARRLNRRVVFARENRVVLAEGSIERRYPLDVDADTVTLASAATLWSLDGLSDGTPHRSEFAATTHRRQRPLHVAQTLAAIPM